MFVCACMDQIGMMLVHGDFNFFSGIAVSLTSAVTWVGVIIIAQVTPILLASSLQTHGTFYLFAGVHIVATLFALLTLPETKVKHAVVVYTYLYPQHTTFTVHVQGETLEGIDQLFSKPWLERINLVYYLR